MVDIAEAEEEDVSQEADVVGDAARSDEQSNDMSDDEHDMPSRGPRKVYLSHSTVATGSDEESDDVSEDEDDVPVRRPRNVYSSYSTVEARPGSKMSLGDFLADQTLGSWDHGMKHGYSSRSSSCGAQEPLESAQEPVEWSASPDESSSSLVQEEKKNSSKVNGKLPDYLLEKLAPRSPVIRDSVFNSSSTLLG